MPIRRAVPRAPITSHLYRRLARLPAGGATGVACAAAGLACAIGLVVVHPRMDLPWHVDRGADQPAAALHPRATPGSRERPRPDPSPQAPSRVRLARSDNAPGGSPVPGIEQPAPTDADDVQDPQTSQSMPPAPIEPSTETPPVADEAGGTNDRDDHEDRLEPDLEHSGVEPRDEQERRNDDGDAEERTDDDGRGPIPNDTNGGL